MAVKPFLIPLSKKYKQYWGDSTPVGHVQFFLFGLLKATVIKQDEKGIYVTLEPSEYWTKEVHEALCAAFASFFNSDDVPELKAAAAKLAAPVNPSALLPDPPPPKKRGRPPKAKPEAEPSVSSDGLEMPTISIDG